MEAEQRHKTMMHREQGRGVAGRGQSRPGRRLILRLESEGRAKRSLEEKHGFRWNCNVCSEIYGNLVLQILFRQDAEVLTICIMKNNY